MSVRVLLADDLYFVRMAQTEVLEAGGCKIVGESRPERLLSAIAEAVAA